MTKIYTRTGDKGLTSLVGGRKVSKGSQRLESYGTIDELSSFLGYLMNFLEDKDDKVFVELLQRRLFVVSAVLATPSEFSTKGIDKRWIEEVEEEIDRMEKYLPSLQGFILPGGCKAASVAHICRTVCRRAERCIVRLEEMETIDDNLLSLVNRISDYLFDLARKQNFLHNVDEKNYR